MRQSIAVFGVLLMCAVIGIPALIILVLIGYLVKGNN